MLYIALPARFQMVFEAVDGGQDRACRGDSSTDNSDLCTAVRACSGQNVRFLLADVSGSKNSDIDIFIYRKNKIKINHDMK